MVTDYTRFQSRVTDFASQARGSKSPNSASRCKSSAEVCMCRSCRDNSRSPSKSRRRRATDKLFQFPCTADIAEDFMYNAITDMNTEGIHEHGEKNGGSGNEAGFHHLDLLSDVGGLKEHAMAMAGSRNGLYKIPRYRLSQQGARNTAIDSQESCQHFAKPPTSVTWSPYSQQPEFRHCSCCGTRTLHVSWAERDDIERRLKCSSCGYSSSVSSMPCARLSTNCRGALMAPSIDFDPAPATCFSPCHGTVAHPSRDIATPMPGTTTVAAYCHDQTPNNCNIAQTAQSLDCDVAPTTFCSWRQGIYPIRDVMVAKQVSTAVPAHPAGAERPLCHVACQPQVQQYALSPTQDSCEVSGFSPYLAPHGPPQCDTAQFDPFVPAVRCRREVEDDPRTMPCLSVLRGIHARFSDTRHLCNASICRVGTQRMTDMATPALPSVTDANCMMRSSSMAGQQPATKVAPSVGTPWGSAALADSYPCVCRNDDIRDAQASASHGMSQTQLGAALSDQVAGPRSDLFPPFRAQLGGCDARMQENYGPLPANERAVYLTPRNLLAPDCSDGIALNLTGASYASQQEPLRQQGQKPRTHIPSSGASVCMVPQSISLPESHCTIFTQPLTPQATHSSNTGSTKDITCPFLHEQRKKIMAEKLAKVASPSTRETHSPQLLQPDSSITNSVPSRVPLRSSSPPRVRVDDPSLLGSFRGPRVGTVPQLQTSDVVPSDNTNVTRDASGSRNTLPAQRSRSRSTTPNNKSRSLLPTTRSEGTAIHTKICGGSNTRWSDNTLPARSDGVPEATTRHTVPCVMPSSPVTSLTSPAAEPSFVQSHHCSSMLSSKSGVAPCQDLCTIGSVGFDGKQAAKGPLHASSSKDCILEKSEGAVRAARNNEAKSILHSVSEALRILRSASDGKGIFHGAFCLEEQDTKIPPTHVSGELCGDNTTKRRKHVALSRVGDIIDRDFMQESDDQVQGLKGGNDVRTNVEEKNRVEMDVTLGSENQIEASGEKDGQEELQDLCQEKSQVRRQNQAPSQEHKQSPNVMFLHPTVAVSLQEPSRPDSTSPPQLQEKSQVRRQNQAPSQEHKQSPNVMFLHPTVAVSLQEPSRPDSTSPPRFRAPFSRPTRAIAPPQMF